MEKSRDAGTRDNILLIESRIKSCIGVTTIEGLQFPY